MKKFTLAILSTLFLFSSLAFADGYCNGRDNVCGMDGIDGIDGTNGRDGTNGIDGRDGVDGANGIDGRDGVRGVAGIAGINSTSYRYSGDTRDTYNYGIASASAIANIPALSHTGSEHGHTGVGVGFGSFNNADVLAIGIMHQVEQVSLKGTVSQSLDMFGNSTGDHAVFGAGASYTF